MQVYEHAIERKLVAQEQGLTFGQTLTGTPTLIGTLIDRVRLFLTSPTTATYIAFEDITPDFDGFELQMGVPIEVPVTHAVLVYAWTAGGNPILKVMELK